MSDSRLARSDKQRILADELPAIRAAPTPTGSLLARASNPRPGELEIWTDLDIELDVGDAPPVVGVVTLALRDIVSGPLQPMAADPREWITGPLLEHMLRLDEVARAVTIAEIMFAVAEEI